MRAGNEPNHRMSAMPTALRGHVARPKAWPLEQWPWHPMAYLLRSNKVEVDAWKGMAFNDRNSSFYVPRILRQGLRQRMQLGLVLQDAVRRPLRGRC